MALVSTMKMVSTARHRNAKACRDPVRPGVAVHPERRAHPVEVLANSVILRANSVILRVHFIADQPGGTGWPVWPAITIESRAPRSRVDIGMDTEYH